MNVKVFNIIIGFNERNYLFKYNSVGFRWRLYEKWVIQSKIFIMVILDLNITNRWKHPCKKDFTWNLSMCAGKCELSILLKQKMTTQMIMMINT